MRGALPGGARRAGLPVAAPAVAAAGGEVGVGLGNAVAAAATVCLFCGMEGVAVQRKGVPS